MVGRPAVWIALAGVLALAAPAVAPAAQLSVSGGVLRYTAAAGKTNNVTFNESPPHTVLVTRVVVGRVEDSDNDPLIVSGCTGSDLAVTCSQVTRAEIDAGDGSDRVTAGGFELPNGSRTDDLRTVAATITGGDGNDALDGGAGGDTLDGGAGDDVLRGFAGDDVLRGGEGDDELWPNLGTDSVTGGDGIDRALFGLRESPTYTLDGLANDGHAGENDLIGADVEDILAAAASSGQVVTMVGDGRANRLKVTAGRANLTGGEGSDVLDGGPEDDTLNSRDGSPDTVICNAGADTALVDTLDTVSPTCENVLAQATPGGPFDDHPPAIAWTAPAAGGSLTADKASTLAVNASDDRGLSRVQFFDDDRLVCQDMEAPYKCAYKPRGADVGRNTLRAVAIDGANQTTSIVRAVTVRRFTPRSLGLSLRPSRDRRAPYSLRATGRLRPPTTVSPSQGCSGTVTVTAKAGRRTVATRHVKLSRACEYRATVGFRSRPASRLRFGARFGGNDVLTARAASSRTARLT